MTFDSREGIENTKERQSDKQQQNNYSRYAQLGLLTGAWIKGCSEKNGHHIERRSSIPQTVNQLHVLREEWGL